VNLALNNQEKAIPNQFNNLNDKSKKAEHYERAKRSNNVKAISERSSLINKIYLKLIKGV
jgi:hypothetical protein